MNKQELRNLLVHATAEYTKPVHTHAESVDQEKRLKKAIKRSQGLVIPENLREQEWQEYLESLK